MDTAQRKRQGHRLSVALLSILLMMVFAASLGGSPTYAAEDTQRNLLNGSFEEGQTWTGNYNQLDQSAVPFWNTTAFQGKIELFRKNKGTYFQNVTLEPTDGKYAAELNADEESTLYQIVDTFDSSVYEWGLDHGARNGTDIMALIIGPNQDKAPSKPSKDGRDQFMQMVDWLIDQYGEGSLPIQGSTGLDRHITVYSKKFAASGAFQDNAGNNAFSLTPSMIYTEEWHIWILSSNRAGDGVTVNPWSHFGSNAAAPGSGSGGLDLSEYYLYTVPAGQTKTLFGFVSVGYVNSPTTPDKAKTYGNFVDNINFTLYHPLSGSSTTHGSAVISSSDGLVIGGETGTDGGYITDGEDLTVQAIVKKEDAIAGCEFVGLYYTHRDSEGHLKTEFLQLAGNEVDESATDGEKVGKWIKSANAGGDTVYTYYLKNLTSSVDLHFVFIKNPTITYDPNGGEPYTVGQDSGEAANVYTFKPKSGEGISIADSFIKPYVSHAAEGQNDGWKFIGWKLTGDTITSDRTDKVNADQLGSLILPAVHTVACDYVTDNDAGKPQYFKIYDNDDVTLTKTIQSENSIVTGVVWADSGATKAYANVHKGLTMVAQWRWRQAFVPQVDAGSGYAASDAGGTVAITSVTDTSNGNYNGAFNTYGKAYFAGNNEKVIVTATAKTGYVFEGWYEKVGEDDRLITKNATYSYEVAANSVKTCYARFSNTVTQTYIRQVMNVDSGTWKNIEGTESSEVGNLGRYSYTDALGMPISSTATAGAGYQFVGWYDSEGNPVNSTMLTNNGATISYTTTGNQTYYARFKVNVAIKVTGESKTVTYDGDSHSISGYTAQYTVNGTTSETAPSYILLQLKDGVDPQVIRTNAGTYPMELNPEDFLVTNSSEVYAYTLQVIPGQLKITKRPVTITVRGNTGTEPYSGVEQTVTGFTVGETPVDVTVELKEGRSAVAKGTDARAEKYTMGLTGDFFKAIGAKAGNYDVTWDVIDGWLQIDRAAHTITVTGNHDTKTYNGDEQAVSGFTYSGNPTGITVQLKSGNSAIAKGTNASDTKYMMGLTEEIFEIAGETAGNYEVSWAVTDGWLKIDKATRTITATGYNEPYDGEAHGITVSGATLPDDTVYYSTDNITWAETAPTRTDVQVEKRIWVKVENPNYEDATADATITITKRQVTITVNNAEKFYHEADPAFTGSISPDSLVNENDLGAITYFRTNSDSGVGTYQGVLTAQYRPNDNYAVTVVPGTFTIKTTVVSGAAVVASGGSKAYDGTPLAVTATLTDEATGYTIWYSTDRGETWSETVPSVTDVADGELTVYVKATQTGHADLICDPVTIKITKADRPEYARVSAASYNGTYDGAAHGITVSGATLPGDTVYYSTTGNENDWSTTAPVRTDVQDAETIYVKAENPNYQTASAQATITITQRPTPIAGDDKPVLPEKESPYIKDYLDCTKSGACPIWPYTDAEVWEWYHNGVHFCLDNSLMIGFGDGIFKPNAPTTRSMITVMLWRLNGSPVVNYEMDFEDVEGGTWYTEAIRWAKSEGVAVGYGNGQFGPEDTLTREQMVSMLYRYARYKAGDVSVCEDTNILSYGDAAAVAEYAIPAMQWACGSGMVIGKQENSGLILDPQGSTTRAEMATMMMRYCAEIMK